MMERIVQLEKLLEAEPDDPFCLYSLAQEYVKREEYGRAVMYYDRTIAADPHYHYAYFHKAKALEADGRVDEAVAALTEGIARARAADDRHAFAELSGYLDELT